MYDTRSLTDTREHSSKSLTAGNTTEKQMLTARTISTTRQGVVLRIADKFAAVFWC